MSGFVLKELILWEIQKIIKDGACSPGIVTSFRTELDEKEIPLVQ